MEELPVLIVGAGPVGLTLAVVLDHLGIAFRIIDRADTPSRISKAAGIQARTLEILAELRLAEAFIERGVRIHASEVRSRGEVVATIDHRTLVNDARYPFLLGLPQADTEAILTQRLERRGITIERGVELTECRSRDGDAVAILRHPDGHGETVRPRWVAGCDGPTSRVRDALRTPVDHAEQRTSYALADVDLSWDGPDDRALLLLDDRGSMQLHPVGADRWRVAFDCGPTAATGRPAPPTARQLRELCRMYLTGPIEVEAVHWSTYYCVFRDRAARVRTGRVFLLGDAAHVHSAITFQGMNAGMQDAWNLGWKLALAERGAATDVLLDSYDAERRDAETRLIPADGEVERLLALNAPLARHAHDVLLPFVASIPGYERFIARATGQPEYAYRSSPAVGGNRRPNGPSLVAPFGSGTVHPGDLAPDAPLTTDAGLPVRDGSSYVSLVFTGPRLPDDGSVLLDVPLPGRLRTRSVIVSQVPGVRGARSGASIVTDVGGAIHRLWGINRSTHVLVRPDGYVGWRSEPPDADALRAYLARLHGADGPVRPVGPAVAQQSRLAG